MPEQECEQKQHSQIDKKYPGESLLEYNRQFIKQSRKENKMRGEQNERR